MSSKSDPRFQVYRQRYDTDPPSVRASGQPVLDGSMFDLARIADAMRRGLVEGLPPMRHPSDELLAATMVSLGMPAFAADQVRHSPQLRLQFTQLWAAVQLAAQGNPDAQERVDVARATFAEGRKIGLISDKPDGSVGLWER